MGVQLVTVQNNINLPGNSSKIGRKKGTRELQNLEFNVNYDCSGCSKGKSHFP